MLPNSLLITRRRREKISPVYAQLSQENIEIAKLLVQTYEEYAGRRKCELDEAVEVFEELGHDYRYVRGLSTLLDRRCRLESRLTIDPVKVRRHVFEISHKRGIPTTLEERQIILLQTASRLETTVEELEESFYGDLEGELILKDFEHVNPKTLLRQYNLSLTQTLLFSATEIEFTAQGNWQNIFRQIKWLGLIYTISRSDNEYQVKVDGPISLFKLNRRYGTSLAKLLPTIIQSPGWSIQAKILPRKGKGQLLNLALNSQDHAKYLEAVETQKEVYDSSVEQDFAKRFKSLTTGWIITREPEPIPVGKQVLIPDFSFRKQSMNIFMEIVGFWTPEYLREKVKKLELLGDVEMIVAADRNLACKELDRVGRKLNVFYYRRRIPLRPVLVFLKAKEERLVEEQVARLSSMDLTPRKPVVELRDLAEELGVEEAAIKEVLNEREIPGYMRLGDILIHQSKLETIHERLEKRLTQGELSFEEASKIIEDEDGKKPTLILDALRYKIEWHGIDPQSAKIHRNNSSVLEIA